MLSLIKKIGSSNPSPSPAQPAPAPAPAAPAKTGGAKRAPGSTTTASAKRPASTTLGKAPSTSAANRKTVAARPAAKPSAKPSAASGASLAATSSAPASPLAIINPLHNTLKDGSSFDGTWDPDTMNPVEGIATFSNGDTMNGKWNDLGIFYEGVFTVLGTPSIVATGSFWYPAGATRPRLRNGALTKGDLSWEGEFDDTTTKGFLRTGVRRTKAAVEKGVFQELPGGTGITLTHGRQAMTKSGVIFEGTFDRSTGKRIEGKETAKGGVVSEGKWKWNGHSEILVDGVTNWTTPQPVKANVGSKPNPFTAKFTGTKNLAGNWVAGEYVMPTGDCTVGTYSVVPTSTSQKKFRLEKGLNDPRGTGGTVREGLFASKSGVTKLVHGRTVAKVTSASDKKMCARAGTPGALEGRTTCFTIQEGDYTDEAFVGTTRLILREQFEVEVASSTSKRVMMSSSAPEVSPNATEEQAEAVNEDGDDENDSGEPKQVHEDPNRVLEGSAVSEKKQEAEPFVDIDDKDIEAVNLPAASDAAKEEVHEELDTTDMGAPAPTAAPEASSPLDDDTPKPIRLIDPGSDVEEDVQIQPPRTAGGGEHQVEDNFLQEEEESLSEEEEPPHDRKVEIVSRTKLVNFDTTKEASVMGLRVISNSCPAFLWFADTITTSTTTDAATGKPVTSTKTTVECLDLYCTALEKAHLCGEPKFIIYHHMNAESAGQGEADAALPDEVVDFGRMETSRGRKIRREAVSVTKANLFGDKRDPHSYNTKIALPQYIWVFIDDRSAEEPDALPIEASLALEDAFYQGDVDEVVFDEEFECARVSLWESPRRYWRVTGQPPKPIRREVMTVAMALETETYLTAFLLLNNHDVAKSPARVESVDGFCLCYPDVVPFPHRELEHVTPLGNAELTTLSPTGKGESALDLISPEELTTQATRDRLIRFFRYYNKTKLSSVDHVLAFKSRKLFRWLEEKYGPEADITEDRQRIKDETTEALTSTMRPVFAMSRHLDVELHGDWSVAGVKSRMLHIAHLKYCTAVFQDEEYSGLAMELIRILTRQWGGAMLNRAQAAARWAEIEAGLDPAPGSYPPFLFETEQVPEGTVRCRFIGDETAVDACLFMGMRWQYNETQFQAPKNWTVAVGSHVDREETIRQEKNANYLYRVSIGTQEHVEVDRFFTAKFKKTIRKIERVQNTVLYEKYINKRRQTSKEHHGDANEARWMFHGTRNTEPMLMCSDGFDMRFCDKGFYGRASYFAYDAHYSHLFRHNNGDGTASLFLALVTCGLIDERPVKDDTIRRPEPPCHSVKGPVNTSGSEAIMIYELNQAYPAYLVTYNI